MKKIAFFIIASIIFAGCSDKEGITTGSIEWKNYEEGMNLASDNEKPVIIDFYADWCEPCKKMEEQLYTDEDVVEKANNFIMIKVNADENRNLAISYGIQYLPTVIFLKNGSELFRITGYDYTKPEVSIQNFLHAMDQAIKGEEMKEDFSFLTLDGKKHNLSDYRGKIVVVDFMATWCYPCKMEMQELEKVLNNYGEDITIISISVDSNDDADKIKNTFSSYVNKWIFGMDKYGVQQKYMITSVPTIYIFDQEGEIAYHHKGLTYANELINEIDKII
ncbi:MAG TPA: redoxin domain-containing protein [Thermoplasmatales archaeon]|nr:redoxin domain-containing protein [Thermoplasmatales archaeon]